MTIKDLLHHVYERLSDPQNISLHFSMADTHHQGVFSLVVDGDEFGKLTRVFISDVRLRPYDVQLHTHRYPIRLTAIRGIIKQHLAFRADKGERDAVELSEYDYSSPLTGGKGLTYNRQDYFLLSDYSIPIGSMISMSVYDFHTMSCSRGSMWIVEELGYQTEISRVLGIPFKTIELYNKPDWYDINDKRSKVKLAIRDLFDKY